MKSRTSSCNLTVIKKDITRFAPAWGIYLIFMLLVLISMSHDSHAYYRLLTVVDSISAFAWLNLIYAAVTAQLIFGDLYNSRMCNALHALPLKREDWFASHVASGFAFSLIPNLLITLIALPVLRLDGGWTAAFWWLLASQLQYAFFFGTAVLCIMLSGNRLGQIALYGMVNFAGVLAYWMASMVYQPFLHGIQFSEDPFILASPLAQMSNMPDALVIDHERIETAAGEMEQILVHRVSLGEGWGYMAICAGVGILALLAALALYRRRQLECAGDFVAFTRMEPVVTVIVTVFVGGVCHLFADAFGMSFRSVMLGAGMVVGFFVCRMLLERTTRVFRKKAFLFCGSIVAIFGLTVLLTYLDPAGITRYVPAPEEVESIAFGQSYTLHSYGSFPYTATSAQEIAALQRVHELGIAKQSDAQPGGTEEVYNSYSLRLEYKLKNGKTVNRFYDVQPHNETGEIMKQFLMRTDCVLGIPEENLASAASCLRSLYTEALNDTVYDMDTLDVQGLFAAIAADCRAGNMVQLSGYHYPVNYDLLGYENIDGVVAYLELGWDRDALEKIMLGGREEYASSYYGVAPTLRYHSVRIYASCENTIRWMEENDLLTDAMKQGIADKFEGYFMWG